MELIVLGCSGSGPGPSSAASGYLVRADGFALVLDLGNGTMGALQRHLDPFDLGALVLSHLHPDHCADVSALAVYRRYHPAASRSPRRALPVHAPSEAPSRLAAAYAPSSAERATTDLADVFAFHRLGGHPVRIGPFVLTAAAVAHPCESYALRLTHAGASLVYSGDTGPCSALVELAEDADLLLCEASWPHDPAARPGVHLSGRQAGEAARDAGVGRLLLTHVPAWCDPAVPLAEAVAVFARPVELARADGRYSV